MHGQRGFSPRRCGCVCENPDCADTGIVDNTSKRRELTPHTHTHAHTCVAPSSERLAPARSARRLRTSPRCACAARRGLRQPRRPLLDPVFRAARPRPQRAPSPLLLPAGCMASMTTARNTRPAPFEFWMNTWRCWNKHVSGDPACGQKGVRVTEGGLLSRVLNVALLSRVLNVTLPCERISKRI